MNRMIRKLWVAIGLLSCVACLVVGARAAKPQHSASMVAHGKYIVTRVGMCGDCHTPKNERGQPIMSRFLQGATLDFRPPVPVPGWTAKSVNIAGLPAGWTYQDTVHFLVTGKTPDGRLAGPPMPAIRLSPRDAEAVAVYLSTLPSGRP